MNHRKGAARRDWSLPSGGDIPVKGGGGTIVGRDASALASHKKKTREKHTGEL